MRRSLGRQADRHLQSLEGAEAPRADEV